jgi:hypothetical protein
MSTTKEIPRAEWQSYFERYSRRFLEGDGDSREAAMVEIVSPTLGDQTEDSLVPVLGMTYDPKSNAFELSLEGVDHLIFDPKEIAVIEEDDGFISALEVARNDGVKEIVRLRRAGAWASRYDGAAPPGT